MKKCIPNLSRFTLIGALGILSVCSALAQQPATQVIDLYPGWNLISIQVGGAIAPSAFKAALDNPTTGTPLACARLQKSSSFTRGAPLSERH
jgi:hypothetical protein